MAKKERYILAKHIAKEIKDEIASFYKSKPMTITELSERFNLSNPTIIKILNQYKIKRYTKVQLFSPNLKEDYFDNIDTQEKAYFLGLIITDGCVYTKGNKQNLVSIALKDEDKYLLEMFKKEVCSNKKVTSDGRGCAEINILSNKMVGCLSKYGILPNKSLNTVFPNALPKEAYPHLLRGIIDGDGSISFYSRNNRKSHTKAIRLCQGNEQFLKDIVEFLANELGTTRVSLFREKDNLWSIRYAKNDDMLKIINYLYSGATIYMKRKKILCDKILEEILR